MYLSCFRLLVVGKRNINSLRFLNPGSVNELRIRRWQESGLKDCQNRCPNEWVSGRKLTSCFLFAFLQVRINTSRLFSE